MTDRRHLLAAWEGSTRAAAAGGTTRGGRQCPCHSLASARCTPPAQRPTSVRCGTCVPGAWLCGSGRRARDPAPWMRWGHDPHGRGCPVRGASGLFRARKPGMSAPPPWKRAKGTDTKTTVATLRDDRGKTRWSQCPRPLGSHRLRHRRSASPYRRPWCLSAQSGCGSERAPPSPGQRSPTLPPRWPPATAHRDDGRRRSYRLKTRTTQSASCSRASRCFGEKLARRPGARRMRPLQPGVLAASLQS